MLQEKGTPPQMMETAENTKAISKASGRLTPDKMAFSGPTWGGLYPQPPHFYRNSQNLMLSYETAVDPVLDLLPEGVELLTDQPRVLLWFHDVPMSTFGPHQGCYAFIECSFRGNPYLFEAFLWVSSESALTAGREFWGDSKKLADIGIGFDREEVVASLERPAGRYLAQARMRLERWGDVDSMPDYPGLCLKMIPSAEEGAPPAVLQLVRDDVVVHPVIGSDGRAEIFAGPASVSLADLTTLDPVTSLVPSGEIQAIYAVLHLELNFGTIIKDYSKEHVD